MCWPHLGPDYSRAALMHLLAKMFARVKSAMRKKKIRENSVFLDETWGGRLSLRPVLIFDFWHDGLA